MARILLAEDEDALRNFLANALERAGHRVRAFANGLDAMEAVKQDAFDLLLADVVMPGMDGIELARRAGKRQPDIKVMFITGFAAVAMSARNDAPVSARVLSKPFHLNDLVGQVQDFLAA